MHEDCCGLDGIDDMMYIYVFLFVQIMDHAVVELKLAFRLRHPLLATFKISIIIVVPIIGSTKDS